MEEVASERKRLRPTKHPDHEKALLLWIREMHAQDIPRRGPVILAKAADFALQLGYDDFSASDGWLHCFREHYFVFRAVLGETKTVNVETYAVWCSEVLQGYMEKYSPQDIFNADETALFFKLLPANPITYKAHKCTGGKRSKERIITVMVAANMTKLPPFAIGKSRSPRCFKHVRSLPADYAANKNAWMTRELFAQWLANIDKKF